MRIDLSYLPALGAAFLLVFARTGTMLMLLPGLGEQNISARMRLTFALLLAAMLLPLHRNAYHIDQGAASLRGSRSRRWKSPAPSSPSSSASASSLPSIPPRASKG